MSPTEKNNKIEITENSISKLNEKDLKQLSGLSNEELTKKIKDLSPVLQKKFSDKLNALNNAKIKALKSTEKDKDEEIKILKRQISVDKATTLEKKIKYAIRGEEYQDSQIEASQQENSSKKVEKPVPVSSVQKEVIVPKIEKQEISKEQTDFDQQVQKTLENRAATFIDYLKAPAQTVDVNKIAQDPSVQNATSYLQYFAGNDQLTMRWFEGKGNIQSSTDIRNYYRELFKVYDKMKTMDFNRTVLDVTTSGIQALSLITHMLDRSNQSAFNKLTSGLKSKDSNWGVQGASWIQGALPLVSFAVLNPGWGDAKASQGISTNDVELLYAASSLRDKKNPNELYVHDLMRYLHQNDAQGAKVGLQQVDVNKPHVVAYKAYLDAKKMNDAEAMTKAKDVLSTQFGIIIPTLPTVAEKTQFQRDPQEVDKMRRALAAMSPDKRTETESKIKTYIATVEKNLSLVQDPEKKKVMQDEIASFTDMLKISPTVQHEVEQLEYGDKVRTIIKDATSKFNQVKKLVDDATENMNAIYDDKNAYTLNVNQQVQLGKRIEFLHRYDVNDMIRLYYAAYRDKKEDPKSVIQYVGSLHDQMEKDFATISTEVNFTSKEAANNEKSDLDARLRSQFFLRCPKAKTILEKVAKKDAQTNGYDEHTYVERLLRDRVDALQNFPAYITKINTTFKALSKGKNPGFSFETFLPDSFLKQGELKTEKDIQEFFVGYKKAMDKAQAYAKILDGVQRNGKDAKIDATSELGLPKILEKMGVKNVTNPEKHKNAFSFMRLVKPEYLTDTFKQNYLTIDANTTVDAKEAASMLNSLVYMFGDISDKRPGKQEYKHDASLVDAMLGALRNDKNLSLVKQSKFKNAKAELDFAKMFTKEDIFQAFMNGAEQVLDTNLKTANLGLQFNWADKNISGGLIGSKNVYKIQIKKVIDSQLMVYDCYIREQCLNIQISPQSVLHKETLTFATPNIGEIEAVEAPVREYPDLTLNTSVNRVPIDGSIDAQIAYNDAIIPVAAITAGASLFVPWEGKSTGPEPVKITGEVTFPPKPIEEKKEEKPGMKPGPWQGPIWQPDSNGGGGGSSGGGGKIRTDGKKELEQSVANIIQDKDLVKNAQAFREMTETQRKEYIAGVMGLSPNDPQVINGARIAKEDLNALLKSGKPFEQMATAVLGIMGNVTKGSTLAQTRVNIRTKQNNVNNTGGQSGQIQFNRKSNP